MSIPTLRPTLVPCTWLAQQGPFSATVSPWMSWPALPSNAWVEVFINKPPPCNRASLGAQVVNESTCNAGDAGSTPGSGRSPGEGSGNLLQYSFLRNPMDRGAWWAIVHGVTRVRHDLVTKPPPPPSPPGSKSACSCT